MEFSSQFSVDAGSTDINTRMHESGPPHLNQPAIEIQTAEERELSLPGMGWLFILIVAVAIMTAWMLLFPFDFVATRQTAWLGERQIHKLNTLSNVILFMPMGMLSAWLLKLWWPRLGLVIVLMVAADAALFSVLGETVQMWLPERQSSLVDLIANAIGGGIGAVLGLSLASWLTYRWCKVAYWLANRSAARKALGVLLILLVVRTAPFDASPETFYLKESLASQTKQAGGPFSKTIDGLKRDGVAGVTGNAEAMAEVRRAGLNFAMFLVAAFALLRAVWQDRVIRGIRGSGLMVAGAIAIGLVLATEVMQWPIRSRLMDATDPVAGAAGVCIGLVFAFIFGQSRPDAVQNHGLPASR